MTLHTSDVDYANGSYMERGDGYDVGDGRVQLHPLKEEEKAEKTQRGVYSVKAHAKEGGVEKSPIAKTIRHIIDWELTQKWYDTERKEDRPVRYSDIAILTRKKQGGISKTVASLTAEGIPVTASSAVNICDFTEIKALIDILSLIDNAEQDVPLCSALLSAMGGLTANDLVEIRLSFKDETFFRVACKRYATERTGELSHRLQRFYQYLQHLRDCACVMNAGEILTKILAETHMESLLLSKENGEASIRRVHRFIEETSVEEPLSVHDFLVRLRNLDYKVEYNENSGEDSVKVITMHASKGLEYPVVILNDISELFHGVDHDEILIEEKYGLAPRSFDENKLIKRGTLLRRLCEKKQQKSTVMDELNLYYVALTRAKYALHIVFGEKSLLQDVRYARSFADFTDFSIWKKYLVEDEIFDVPYAERQALAFNPNKELTNSIMQAFQWEYSHKGLENLPVKSSATQLLGQYVYEEDGREEKVVEAVVEGGTGTSIEAGLAYHAFLERFDFAKLLDGAGNRISKETLVSLIEKEYDAVADKDKKYVSKEKLVEILSNDVFYRLEGMRLYKEQVFLASLPVRDTYAKKADIEESVKAVDEAEEMIFQGAIDLLAVGKNTAWVIDYKYSQKNAEQLKEHYYPQLDLYKKTTAKILKIPEENVRCTIVNIYRGFQVDVE